jgi:hypothetical protein
MAGDTFRRPKKRPFGAEADTNLECICKMGVRTRMSGGWQPPSTSHGCRSCSGRPIGTELAGCTSSSLVVPSSGPRNRTEVGLSEAYFQPGAAPKRIMAARTTHSRWRTGTRLLARASSFRNTIHESPPARANLPSYLSAAFLFAYPRPRRVSCRRAGRHRYDLETTASREEITTLRTGARPCPVREENDRMRHTGSRIRSFG